MIKTLGVVMGLLFLLGGIIGFVPGVIQNGLYLGIFRVNTAHGIVHIFSGAVFLFASMAGPRAVRGWFQIFGVVYAAVAAMGFEVGEGLICGVISNNQYDAWVMQCLPSECCSSASSLEEQPRPHHVSACERRSRGRCDDRRRRRVLTIIFRGRLLRGSLPSGEWSDRAGFQFPRGQRIYLSLKI